MTWQRPLSGPDEIPDKLREANRAFIESYNYHRYHKGLGDITPYDVYTGRRLQTKQRRMEVKSRISWARKRYNSTARKQDTGL